MAAPSPSTRLTPLGARMKDGYQTLICFAADKDVSLWERDVKPPGVDGGAPVDNTVMFNQTWTTKRPRALKTATEGSFNCGWDPRVYDKILRLINVETTVTVHFPDGSTVAFYGYLQKFEPGDMKEGEMPMASCQVTPTNWDYVNNVEAGPAWASATGTGT